MYEQAYRRLISRTDPERAHRLAVRALATAARTPGGLAALGRSVPEPDERLRLRAFGLPFANPLGVAAGLDKDGEAVEALLALGFGHVEVGTVTLRPQPGNERPRVWRAVEQRSLVNAMGFPSDGAAAVRQRMIRLNPRGVVGINIGKNRDTDLDHAAEDYAGLVAALFEVAHYITVNVSSPNTPGLRSLQLADDLTRLLGAVRAANELQGSLRDRDPKPILVKIAPDLSDEEIEATAASALAAGVDGIVATNTTTSRAGLPAEYSALPGGRSGAVLKVQATHVVRVLHRALAGRLPIVGVGGIATGADALQRIRAGATLVQLYSAFTFAGPALPGQVLRELSAAADREGWRSLSELVGVDAG